MELFSPKMIYGPLGENARWFSYLVEKRIVEPYFDSGMQRVTKLYAPREALKAGMVKFLGMAGYPLDVCAVIASLGVNAAHVVLEMGNPCYVVMRGMYPVSVTEANNPPHIIGYGMTYMLGETTLNLDIMEVESLGSGAIVSFLRLNPFMELACATIGIESSFPNEGDFERHGYHEGRVELAEDIAGRYNAMTIEMDKLDGLFKELYHQCPLSTPKKNDPKE